MKNKLTHCQEMRHLAPAPPGNAGAATARKRSPGPASGGLAAGRRIATALNPTVTGLPARQEPASFRLRDSQRVLQLHEAIQLRSQSALLLPLDQLGESPLRLSTTPTQLPSLQWVNIVLPMYVFRPLVLLFLSALPSLAATFGTVVAHSQPLADLVLDEARKRLYVVNTASNQVEVYGTNTNPPRQTNIVKTDAVPLAIAMSRSGKSLYVACYGASSLDIIDLTSATFASQSVTLAASPEGLAVGFNEKVLISTIGTGVGQDVLITFDPTVAASQALGTVVIAPAAPSAPSLPPPNGAMALASHARLQASQNGRTIIGVHDLANNTRTVYVFDVNSSTILASRNIPVISPVVAVSADGSRFVSGPTLFETSSLLVLAQQSAINSPFVFPTGANFNTQTSQGGAVYAQTAGGPVLVTAYNIVPELTSASSNTSQLLFNNPDNLLIELGIQIPETLSGKMVITSDSATIYAISQSGFMVLPIGTLPQVPIAIPDSNVALLASDQCGVTASQNSAVIPVRNAGGRTLTATVQVLTTTATSVTTKVTSRSYGGDVTAQFNSAAARTLGTAAPDQLLIQSSEAVNIVPNVRVFQNSRNSEARGNIIPVDIGATTTGLTDMLADAARQRLYIANPGLNRIEIFDMQQQQFLAPIPVGQLPRSLAFGTDGNTMYVAASGSETINIVDLTKQAVVGRVSLPPIPFNATFAIITPMVLASSEHGPQVIMSDGTPWKIVGNTLTPRTLNTNIVGNIRSVPAPQTLAGSPEGAFVLLLAGNGSAYLYDSSIDDFVSVRSVIPTPIQGYYGPIAAGPNGQYFLTDDQVLNQALTPIGTSAGSTGPVSGGGLPSPSGPSVTGRPVSAVAAVGAQSFARFSTPVRASASVTPTDAGLIEIVDVTTQRTTASANALEGPLTEVTGTARVTSSGRTMALDSSATTAYVLTASGLSIIPIATATAQTTPQLPGSPVVNAANFTAAVAPVGLISIFGKNLAATATASATPLPTILGGTCVTLNNAPIPLLAATPGQINAQVPPTLAAGRYPLVIRSIANQAASGSATITVSKFAPAVFFDAQGPMIFHKDGTRVDKQHPATRDEELTIYATGLGVTNGGRVTAGVPSPSSPLAVTGTLQIWFGPPTRSDTGVIVDWSGLAPGLIGVYQINCRIPGTHYRGDALPVTLKIGGVSSVTTGPTAAVVYVD